jgi:hypothetical protein
MGFSHAAVHDDGEPGHFGQLTGLFGLDSYLEPQHFCSDRDGLTGDRGRFLRGSEDIHYVHGHVDFSIKAMTGIAHIDGMAYVFMGDPGNIGSTQTMMQTNLTVTPTKSIFTLQGGGVTLTVTFLSPVEADDIQKLSVPLSYILAEVQSNDGQAHDVSLYFDISGEWA